MSKKQQDKKGEEAPLDHLTQMKNMQYTVVLREAEINNLKVDNNDKGSLIMNLEGLNKELRNNCINAFKNEKELKTLASKVEALERDNDKLRNDAITAQHRYDDEKRQMKTDHDHELGRMKSIVETATQKIEMVNGLIKDKEIQAEEIEKLNKEKEKIINDHMIMLQRKEVANQNKFSSLKKKMMENINQTQSKVTELNIQYMDVSTKLTLLQNHQLLIQLEFQTQQIEELLQKKEALEKKVFEMSKDLEIHKEVELSLAEKNKRLQTESNNKRRETEPDEYSNLNYIHAKNNTNQTMNTDNSNTKDYCNIVNLEKKVYNLEKKLNHKSKEYNQLKSASEYIELRLRKYEKKYAGLFSFFEESLQNFIEDEEIKNNKEIYINIESLQQGEFSSFSKEEKYSVLVIMMKYLLPLINSNEHSIQQSKTNNVGLKFRYSQKYMDDPELKKVFAAKGVRTKPSPVITTHSYDSLPSIKNLR